EREKTRSSASWVAELLDAAENPSVPSAAETDRAIMKPLVAAMELEACKKAFDTAWKDGTLLVDVSGPIDFGEDGPKTIREVYEHSRAEPVAARKTVEQKTFAYVSDPSKLGVIAS